MNDLKTLKINETFLSIQGESTYAGRLCYFIRLCGCNLTCSYCDTMYAHSESDNNFREITINEIINHTKKSNCKLVEITGGEPLLQKNVILLINNLLDNDFEVMIETNGSIDIAKIDIRVKRVIDCKLPSSNMSQNNLYKNYDYLTSHDEVKFVIGSRKDYEFAREIINKFKLSEKTQHLLFSPVWGTVDFKDIVQWMIEDNIPARFQLQMHKIIWDKDTQGV